MKNEEYTYDINHVTIDKNSGRNLFACHTLARIMTIFTSTFFIAYIYGFSLDAFDYIKRVCIYYIATQLAFFVMYFLFAYITDRTNRIWLYRFSLLIKLIFMILIIYLGKSFAQRLFLAGSIIGTANACYYASYNVLKQEMVSRKTMGNFSAWLLTARKLIDVIVPVTLGALIETSTFLQASIYVSVVVAVMLFLSFFVKAKKPQNSSFSMREYFKKLKALPNKTYRDKLIYIYWASFVYGATATVTTLIDVCVMLQMGSVLSIGWLSSVVSVVSIIVIILFNRFTKPGKRTWVYLVSMGATIVASALFCSWSTTVTVIVFNIGSIITKVIIDATYDSYRNSNIKEAGLYSEIAEHQTLCENIQGLSKLLSYIVVFLLSLTRSLLVFKITLFAFMASYCGTALMMMLYEKKYLSGKRKVESATTEEKIQSENEIKSE